MKKIESIYAAPVAEIIYVDTVDVILTSGPEDPDTTTPEVGPWVGID